MTVEADLIVDRRRLRRQVSRWRALAFLALGLMVAGLGWLAAGRPGTSLGQDHIARVALGGLVTYDRPYIALLDSLADNKLVKGVVLRIDSPGGSTAGSEAIYDALRRIAERKPVVAVVGTLGASGAYVAALASDHIVSAQTSLVGSIGVLIQWAEFDQAMKTLGVKFQEVKTSPLKASPNGFEPASEEAKAALKALIDDSYKWFTGLVKERRGLKDDELKQVSDGRVFTGRQALDLKLVDELGDEKTARAWLAKEKNLALRLPVRNYQPQRDNLSSYFGFSASHLAARAGANLGLPAWLIHLFDEETPHLDGLVSVWHP